MQLARLVIADGRRLAFAAFHSRPLDAFDRMTGLWVTAFFSQRGGVSPNRRKFRLPTIWAARYGRDC
jgi:hypothetical protein